TEKNGRRPFLRIRLQGRQAERASQAQHNPIEYSHETHFRSIDLPAPPGVAMRMARGQQPQVTLCCPMHLGQPGSPTGPVLVALVSTAGPAVQDSLCPAILGPARYVVADSHRPLLTIGDGPDPVSTDALTNEKIPY